MESQIDSSPAQDEVCEYVSETDDEDDCGAIKQPAQITGAEACVHTERSASVEIPDEHGEDYISTLELETEFNDEVPHSYVVGNAHKYVVGFKKEKRSTAKKVRKCCGMTFMVFCLAFVTIAIVLGYYVKPDDKTDNSSNRNWHSSPPTPTPAGGTDETTPTPAGGIDETTPLRGVITENTESTFADSATHNDSDIVDLTTESFETGT